MEDIIKCPLCEKQIIIDEYRSHDCSSKITDVITIGITTDHGIELDKNGDEVQLVKTVDGRFLRLVRCAHQIPHNLHSNRHLTGRKTNREDNRAFKQYLY